MKKRSLALSLACALGLSLLSGCNQTPKETPQAGANSPVPATLNQVTFEDTVVWDGRYDVVVVGFGGSGAVAASNAADEGAKVLIVEKAPLGSEGGNTRVCGQMFVYGNGNYEDTLTYYKALAGTHHIPEAMLEVYCRQIANMTDVVAEEFDLDKNDFLDAKIFQGAGSYSPEYPELPGAGSISLMATHDAGISDGYLWSIMRQRVMEKSDNIDVWFESPAVHLIQDPGNKTILGVQVERGGKTLNIRATNGVVMCCGGFENNKEMVETYLGLSESVPQGSLYNTGDGHRMVMEVGADMWHMDVYEGMGASIGSTTPIAEQVSYYTSYMPPCNSGSVMLVSGEGSRFLDESESTRHGHIKNGDVYENPWYPDTMYLLMSAENYQTALAYQVAIPAEYEYTYSGNTLEELAQAAGMDAAVLAETVRKFNSYAATGVDVEFGRSAESMKAFPENGPYYAVRLAPVILNTQGGGRRNENAEVLDTDGNPIPHLYSAGEFGGICALQYQGGGNVAECIIFGQIAGRNAAKAKSYTSTVISEVESAITYTPGVETDLKASDYSGVTLDENEYLGVGSGGMGGDIALKVTIVDGAIQAIEVVEEHETPDRFAPVKDTMIPAIIEANSTDVDGIASSTLSSNAVKAAVEDAFNQAK